MKPSINSHLHQFHWRDVLRLIAGPVAVTASLAALLHLTAATGLLPPPRPTLDTDRTIIIHQADAARTTTRSEVILIGDSSCLMDVSARDLSEALGRPTLNLGTASYLDLAAYARLLQRQTASNTPALVVLLMHPEALRRIDSEPYHLAVLNHFLEGRDHSPNVARRLLGADIVSGRLLARALPQPLPGAYGGFYGFNRDLERYMSEHHGSAVDPGHERFSGNAEYRLAPTLARASQTFRAMLPPQTRLAVGITPVPEGFAGPSFPARRNEMLRQWAEWLRAEEVLTSLPATLPDDRFARVTHLTPASVPDYTRRLSEELRPLLAPGPSPFPRRR